MYNRINDTRRIIFLCDKFPVFEAVFNVIFEQDSSECDQSFLKLESTVL